MTKETKSSENNKPQAENIVFIGSKPFMNYITGVVTQFSTKNQKEVIIKARGKFITRAVDVADGTVKRFLKDSEIRVKDVKIGSESFKNQEGKNINISTIEICLEKKD